MKQDYPSSEHIGQLPIRLRYLLTGFVLLLLHNYGLHIHPSSNFCLPFSLLGLDLGNVRPIPCQGDKKSVDSTRLFRSSRSSRLAFILQSWFYSADGQIESGKIRNWNYDINVIGVACQFDIAYCVIFKLVRVCLHIATC